MKKRFERSPHPIPVLSPQLLPALLDALKTISAKDYRDQDKVRLQGFAQSPTFEKIMALVENMPDRVRLVSGR